MHDMVIIGGGPAGLTAGLYAARAGLDALLLEGLVPGGQAATTGTIENYPGFPGGVDGYELGLRIQEQAQAFGLQTRTADVAQARLEGTVKTLHIGSEVIEAKAVILCMGASPKMLGVPGEERFRGRGVSYCATCDGALYKGKRVAVVGGGDTAAEDARYLAQMCGEVLLVHRRDTLRATKALAVQALSLPNVRPVWNTHVTEVLGKRAVTGVMLDTAGEAREESVDGVFIAVGTQPQTRLAQGQVALSARGYIAAGEDMRTSLPLVYAAGDIREKSLRQVVTAAADGAVAVHSALEDLLA